MMMMCLLNVQQCGFDDWILQSDVPEGAGRASINMAETVIIISDLISRLLTLPTVVYVE